jgi:4-amino-4-deoxy-L-arabinose transferase-like glycosyltransferase
MKNFSSRLSKWIEKSSNYSKLLLIFVCIGAILRILAILILNDYTQPLTVEYGAVARNLATGRGFIGGGWLGPEGPTALNTPIYPLFLAMWLSTGLSMPYLWVQISQALLSALIIYFTAEIARLRSSRLVGIVTAFGLVFYPPLIYFCKQISPAIFCTFFTVLTIYAVMMLSPKPTMKRGLIMGVVSGFALLTEPILLVGIPGMTLVVLSQTSKASRKRLLSMILLSGLICSLILAPWIVRNYRVFDKVIPLKTSFGLNLWMGNNPNATGYLYTTDGIPMQDTLSTKMKTHLSEFDEATRYNILRNMALEWIFKHPKEFLGLTIKRIGYLWWISPTYRITTANITESQIFYIMRGFIQGLTLLLGGLGSIVALRHNKPLLLHVCWWILAFTAPYAVSVAGNTRYRLPAEPLIVILIAVLAVKHLSSASHITPDSINFNKKAD